MNDDWKPYVLADLIHIKHGFAFKGEHFSDESTPDVLVTPGNFAIGGGFKNDRPKYYRGPVPEDYILQPEDLIVTMTDLSKAGDTLGYPALVPASSVRYLHNQRIGLVKIIDPKLLNRRFLFYRLCGADYRHHVLATASGSTVRHTSPGRIQEFRTVFPLLPEQLTIAGVLGALDDKIESNRQTGRALEKLARAIFHTWFVDFEPVKAKAAGARSFPSMPQEAFEALPTRFVESELGLMPEGWQAMALFDTANYINGAAFKASDFCEQEKGLPIVKIAELKNGIGGQTQYTCRNVDAGQRIDSGDMLYSWSGNPDTSLDVFLWTKGPGVLNQHIFKIVTTTFAQKRFVYYLLRHLRPQLVEIARNKQTTGLGHVTIRDMKGLMVVKAPNPIKESFDTVVGPIFDKCFFAEIESAKLAALRDYLLPKLLSGQVRMSEVERSTS